MRLSQIKLAGFKSFVDATQLPLPVNLTAVVGPNGCGKSNIIDAVRWVLGEASIKTLRGADSEDVIFNGSRSRKPAGRASVELLFDNSDGQVSGPYAAYAEIAVKRELSRDGNSQYYLNSRKCLKRDVTDLFLGTGLGGKNQYAIIEQGMVSRMVEAKPEELRHWLEEAAGISKYKERRRDTESRIRQTRENLSRLQDLQNEIDKRVEVLAKQAENAQKYRDYKQSERQTRAELLLLRARALKVQSEAHEAAIAVFAEELEAAKLRIQQAAESATAAESAQTGASQIVNAEQALVFDAEARAARADQSLIHARELLALQQREHRQSIAQLEEIDRRLIRETEREALARATLAEAADRVEISGRAAETAQGQMAAADQLLQEVQTTWDTVSGEAQTPLLEAEGERVRVQQLDRSLRTADERAARLATERAALQTAPLKASIQDADADIATLGGEFGAAQSRAGELDAELASLREARSGREREINDIRQTLGAARGRLASLDTLQQAALREDDKDYRSWIERNGFKDTARVADLLRVQAGWEAAVEHVLQVLLHAPIVPQADGLQSAPQAGPRAGGALLAADKDGLKLASPATADSLANQVQGPSAILQWLAPVRLADSAAEAAQIADSLASGESVVTKDGVWRGRGWLRYPQTDASQIGVIARGAELRELRANVEKQSRNLAGNEAALGDLIATARILDAERRELGGRIDQLRTRQAQRLSFRQAQAVRLEQMENREKALEQEAALLATQREQFAAEIDAARLRLTDLDLAAERARAARAQAQARLSETRAAAQTARALAVQATQKANDARLAQASALAASAALTRAIEDLKNQRQTAAAQVQLLADRATEAEKPLQENDRTLAAARAEVEAAREKLRTARTALSAAEAARSEATQAWRASESLKDAAAERLQTARLEFENLRTRLETLAGQFAETGFEQAELETGLNEEATVAGREDKLAQLARRIDRLGAINLAAIAELDEARERQTYFAAQRADVEQALSTLEDAMRKLDHETEGLFRETFDRVNGIFRDRFPRIFGGGEAYLELTSDDLLETGVRVMARPPGKRNSSIQLLSGGEKAMTAVALLLALFELNPAPFCLMDEVDAPLDDANVGRYCEVLREMSQRVQFIIITHNKITMELASRLHGVTMQEPGVSRLVSVDVEQALAIVDPSVTTAEAGT